MVAMDEYTVDTTRVLDDTDDRVWISLGGSNGQVGGGGTGGCTKISCPQLVSGGGGGGGKKKPALLGGGGPPPASMFMTCWYDHEGPGPRDISTDIFLGCDDTDPYGNIENINPNGGGYNGKNPRTGGGGSVKTNCDGQGAMAPGNQTQPHDTNHEVTIIDENSIWPDAGGQVLGWVYFGDDGQRYAQLNPNIDWISRANVNNENGLSNDNAYGFPLKFIFGASTHTDGAGNPTGDLGIWPIAPTAASPKPGGGGHPYKCKTGGMLTGGT